MVRFEEIEKSQADGTGAPDFIIFAECKRVTRTCDRRMYGGTGAKGGIGGFRGPTTHKLSLCGAA